MTRRKITWWAACAATGAAIAALTAAPAKADSASFLAVVHAMGWYSSAGDADLLDAGYAACSLLSIPGNDGNDVAAAIYRNTGWDVDIDDARLFVIAAVENLCPEFDNRGQTQGDVA